jgi:hypothetical protein
MTNAAVSIEANYVDGVAPVTLANVQNGAWTRGDVTLSASDADAEQGTPENPAGAGLGEVSKIRYWIDSVETIGTPDAAGSIEVSLASAAYADGLHTIKYCAEDAAGNVEEIKTLVVYKDSAPPSGEIAVRGLTYSTFSASADPQKFWTGDVDLSISGSDEGSGMDEISYIVSDEPFESADAAKDATGWISGDSIKIDGNGTYFVCAKITDEMGNEGFVSTDGFVRYEQSAGTSSTSFEKTSDADAKASISMHGNVVRSVAKEGEDGADELASDCYEAKANEVAFNAEYLQTLGAGYHVYTVLYDPLGVPYEAGQNSDEPLATRVTVHVEKKTLGVALSVELAGGSSTYNANNATLIATVSGTNGYPPEGDVEFRDVRDGIDPPEGISLGEAEVGENGEARLTVTLGGGTHTLRAVYGGDENYEEAESSDSAQNISRANQTTPLSISGGGMSGGEISKTYGDQSFELTAEGGNGSGSYVWRSSDRDIASVGSSTGRVNIRSAGNVTLFAKKAQDDDYNDSDEVSVTLKIARRTPIIATEGILGSVKYSENAVGAIDLSLSGYLFGGAPMIPDESILSGTFAWDDPSIAPGADGFLADSEGNDAKAGLYLARATFEPDPVYADKYGSLSILVPVKVTASTNLVQAIEDTSTAAENVLPEIEIARENYEEASIDSLIAAIEAVRAAREPQDPDDSDSPNLLSLMTEGEVENMYANIDEALDALIHDHPVQENSASAPITQKGFSVKIKWKGDFASVTDVLLNSRAFVRAGSDSPDRIALSMDGKAAGTLLKGSAVADLNQDFVDGLEDGTYNLLVRFVDGFKTGEGTATFIIDRDDGGDTGGGNSGGGDTGGGNTGGGNSGGGNAGGGDTGGGNSGGGNAGGGNSDGGNAGGGNTGGGNTGGGNAGGGNAGGGNTGGNTGGGNTGGGNTGGGNAGGGNAGGGNTGGADSSNDAGNAAGDSGSAGNGGSAGSANGSDADASGGANAGTSQDRDEADAQGSEGSRDFNALFLLILIPLALALCFFLFLRNRKRKREENAA